jgi:type II secretory pathway pseudopilin PulG
MMQERKLVSLGKQKGISLTGLILVLMVLGVFALLAIKIVPSYLEFRAARDAIARAKAAGGSVADMRASFDKFAGVNDVQAIRGRDLVIEREGDTQQISFAYEKRIPLTGRATLVIDYDGTTDPSGVVAAKAGSD